MILSTFALGAEPLSTVPRPGARGLVSVRGTAFLRQGRARGIVRVGGSANPDFRILSATSDFITRPTDVQANRQFNGTLRQPLEFTRSIFGSRLGEMQAGWGEMILDNTEGDYDYLIRDYAIDGRSIVVRLGEADSAYDTFGVVFDGTATGWHVEEDQVRIRLRDLGYLLEVPALTATYGGTGGMDGTADLKGKRKPRALGFCENIRPAYVIPNEETWQVNDGPVQDIPAVYVRGAALQRGPNYATPPAMAAATVQEGFYVTCLAAGAFRLRFANNAESGQVTADVVGDTTGGTFAGTTASIIRRVLAIAGIKPERIDTDRFNTVEARQASQIGFFLETGSEAQVGTIIDQLVSGIGGWSGFRRNGRFEIGVLTEPANPPVAAFDEVEIISIERVQPPDDIDPPWWRVRVPWGRNWTVQINDLLGIVKENADRVAWLAESVRLGEAKSEATKADHPLAQDPEPREGFFRNEADATAEAVRQQAMFGRQRGFYRMELKAQPFTLDIGDVVSVTFPRWDLVSGRLIRIVELRENADANTVEIVGMA